MPDSPELIVIVAVMEEEVAPLRLRLEGVEEIKDGPRCYYLGTLGGVRVAVAATGDGKRNADLGIRRVIQKLQPTRVLVLGLAGALSDGHAVGDLLISSEVMEGERTLAWPDLQWLEDAQISVQYQLGRLVTVDEILSTPESKKILWSKTWRDQPAAADMESACFARVASAYNLPYLVARAISDDVNETLPDFLEDCRAQDGSLDYRQIMWKAFWRPRSWLPLVRLRRRMRICSLTLADFAEALVGSLAH
jgi:adenosylhomocysteine nucleosidase